MLSKADFTVCSYTSNVGLTRAYWPKYKLGKCQMIKNKMAKLKIKMIKIKMVKIKMIKIKIKW